MNNHIVTKGTKGIYKTEYIMLGRKGGDGDREWEGNRADLFKIHCMCV